MEEFFLPGKLITKCDTVVINPEMYIEQVSIVGAAGKLQAKQLIVIPYLFHFPSTGFHVSSTALLSTETMSNCFKETSGSLTQNQEEGVMTFSPYNPPGYRHLPSGCKLTVSLTCWSGERRMMGLCARQLPLAIKNMNAPTNTLRIWLLDLRIRIPVSLIRLLFQGNSRTASHIKPER